MRFDLSRTPSLSEWPSDFRDRFGARLRQAFESEPSSQSLEALASELSSERQLLASAEGALACARLCHDWARAFKARPEVESISIWTRSMSFGVRVHFSSQAAALGVPDALLSASHFDHDLDWRRAPADFNWQTAASEKDSPDLEELLFEEMLPFGAFHHSLGRLFDSSLPWHSATGLDFSETSHILATSDPQLIADQLHLGSLSALIEAARLSALAPSLSAEPRAPRL